MEDRDGPLVPAVHYDGMREQILREARATEYAVWHPALLPVELRTEQWQRLVDAVEALGRDPDRDFRTMWLLHRLHMHAAVYELARAAGPRVAFLRAQSSLMLGHGTRDLERVERVMEKGSWAAVECCYLLAAHAGKIDRDPAAVESWSSRYEDHLGAADREPLELAKLQSRLHRVRAFAPMLRGDMTRMRDEMGAAHAQAIEAAQFADDDPELVVVSCALYESWTKAMMLVGDDEQALIHASAYTTLAPLMPNAWLNYGHALVEAKQEQDAWGCFRAAARYGPPGTAEAWFMVGQCHELWDEPYHAIDAYVQSLDADPQGYPSLEQLAEVAAELNDPDDRPLPLADWARSRLVALRG